MWIRFVLKPWWARALIAAFGCGIVRTASWCLRGLLLDSHGRSSFAIAGSVAAVVILGLLLAAVTIRSHAAYTEALAGLDSSQRSAAVGASLRGPVPADPRVRDAAIRVAERVASSAHAWRRRYLILLALVVLGVGLRLAMDGWPIRWDQDDWILGALFIGAAAVSWWRSISARNRLQVLRSTHAS
jgi:hypothetical protein